MMKHREFLNQLQHASIVHAIRKAEAMTSGEIRVFISRKKLNDPVVAAQEHFIKMGMTKTAQRNGVLIFVAPRSQKFAVIGDEAIHAKCGEQFWGALADEMTPHFAAGRFTDAIVHGILRAGALLAEHFPHQANDRNELPDEIEHD